MLETLQQIPIDKLRSSPFNPRKSFPKAELAELADSITTQGVIDPLLVREVATNGHSHFEIVDGERRFRAAQIAGLKTLPVRVRVMTDTAAREVQLVTFLQKTGINALEEAQAFQDLLKAANSAGVKEGETRKLDVKELAARVGKSDRHVYSRLELLALEAPIRKALSESKISAGHAQELVPLKAEQREEMLEELLDYDNSAPMSVQDLRDEIKYRYAPKPKAPQMSAREKTRHAAEVKRQVAEVFAGARIGEIAGERIERAAWPKMKTLPAARLLPIVVDAVLEDRWDVQAAMKITGHKAPRLALAAFIEWSKQFGGWRKPRPTALALAKACGVDVAKIRKAVEAEEKAKTAKAAVLPTSAKPSTVAAKAGKLRSALNKRTQDKHGKASKKRKSAK